MTSTAILMVDSRSSAFRRLVGPLAWAVLEEAALGAPPPGRPGSPVCSISVRTVVDQLGVGKAAAARAISVLVDAGVLIRLPPSRGRDGRFDRSGYLLRLPEGLALSPSSVPGPPSPGVSDTADDPSGSPTGAGGDPKSRARGHVGALGQASLFDTSAASRADPVDVTAAAPLVPGELVGAGLPDGYECVVGVHELAPGVRAAGLSRSDPSGGGTSC